MVAKSSSKPTANKKPEALSPEVSAAVILLKDSVCEAEALDLAREAVLKKLTEGQLKNVVSAFRSQVVNIRNPGAWLREAIRRKFAPPAAPTTHYSDLGQRPQNIVTPSSKERKAWEAEQSALKAHQNAALAAWDGLDDSRRTELLERALADFRAENLKQPIRKAIERQGTAHKLVIGRAKALLEKELKASS